MEKIILILLFSTACLVFQAAALTGKSTTQLQLRTISQILSQNVALPNLEVASKFRTVTPA